MTPKVSILETGIRITNLAVERKDVADFLYTVNEDEVESTLVQAIEVGVFCLERARVSQDTEFIRRQIDLLLNHVELTVRRIPEDTQKAIIEKLGTNNGQALAPVRELVDSAARMTSERIKDVRTLLTQEIDPEKESTTLGKALKSFRELLDPKRNDSVQGLLEQAVKSVTSKDGSLVGL